MRHLWLILGLVGCGREAPTVDPGPVDPAPETPVEPAAAVAPVASPDAPDLEPTCSPKRCLARGGTWRELVRSVRTECHAAGRRATRADQRWADRARDRDRFHVIRRDRATGDEVVDRVGSLRCDLGLPSGERLSMVWLAFHTEAAWHGCELASDLADIYVAELTPRQIVTAQWIEGGPPEVITRVTREDNLSDAGEASTSTIAERYICGLEGEDPVCWGAIQTELESYSGSESCDEDGRCEHSEDRSAGEIDIEPMAGDQVRLVRGAGALADAERVVSIRQLPCE